MPPPATRPSRLGSWWAIVGFALVLLLALGWRFIADPSLSAPTRDPAWYTWRASVILEDDPGSIAGDWGPDNLFSGGYRVTVPLAGALLQRVSGISTYSFSAFLMLGIPILTGLALGAGAFRSKRDPLIVILTMLATAGLFLTTPYVGYLDNITVLFLLSLIVAFADAARTSWGARVAIFLIGMAAAFTHPTTCVLFGDLAARGLGYARRHEPLPARLGDAIGRPAPAVDGLRHGHGARPLGRGDLGTGRSGAPEGRRAAAPVHRGVLPTALGRVGDFDAARDHVPADPDRDPRHDRRREADPDAGLAVRAGLDLVDVPVRRRAHVPARTGDPVLPLHERHGGPDGAHGSRRVPRRPMVVPGRGRSEDRRSDGSARRRGRAHLGLPRPRDQPVGAAGQPMGAAERADLAGGDPGGGGRRRRAAEHPDRELRQHRRRDGIQHDVRMGEDVHQRLPHRSARRPREVPDELRRDRRGLPRGPAVGRTERELPRHVDEPLERGARAAGDLPGATRGVPDRGVLLGPVQRRPRG